MGRKVFISVLGTTKYRTCTYSFTKSNGEFFTCQTKFIQVATLDLIEAQNWEGNDKIYIFVTKGDNGSEKKNWEVKDDIRDGESYIGLHKTLSDKGFKAKVESIIISDGNEQDEIWDIFNEFYDLIKEGDELYFDITHGYRYIPMLVLVFGNYTRFMKKTVTKHISYGKFEVTDAEKPIVDLLPLAILQNWTSAAASFQEMGMVSGLVNALNDELRAKTFQKKSSISLVRLGEDIKSFEGQILTCRGKELIDGHVATAVNQKYKTIKREALLPRPLKEILQEVLKSLSDFKDKSTDNIVSALKWCKRFKLVQQGYTLCQEGLITIACEQLGDSNPYKKAKDNRNYWSAIFAIDDKTAADESQWQSYLAKNRELTRKMLLSDWVINTRKEYYSLTQHRNDINHGGFTTDKTAEEIIKDFEGIVDKCIRLMSQDITLPKVVSIDEKPKVFVNVSNHPTAKWSEGQLKEARRYGQIEEIGFPLISPYIDCDEAKSLVEETISRIDEKISGKNATVHIMGEMTLTFALVKRLQAKGIRCVASTTERCVKELDGGIKESTFKFVRFREYE